MNKIQTLFVPFFHLIAALIYRFLSRISRYILSIIVINSLIWLVAFVTIKSLPERYDSQWTLILPGSGVGGRVDIESIGSASAIIESGFSSRNLSPKVNYKSIAQSGRVLELAATSLNLSADQFGKPKIKLVDQTSLIFFTMSGKSPNQAQQKSWALYEALQTEVDRLRLDEIQHREQGIQTMLKTFSNKLNTAKEKLLKHQAESNIVTIEQFQRIPLIIEDMRVELLSLEADKQKVYQEMMTLHTILGLTSKQASQLLELQADPLFNELLSSQSKTIVKLSEQRNILGASHPTVKKLLLAKESVTEEINQRISTLFGKQLWLDETALSDNPKRNELLYDLIQKKITYEGNKQKIELLKQQISDYDLRLQGQTKTVSRLDELKREHQIAEAVFTSAVAKIDTGKSDIFASYPMLQLFMEPTLPNKTSGAKPLHIYLGSMMGSLLSTIIFIILWIRRRNIRENMNTKAE